MDRAFDAHPGEPTLQFPAMQLGVHGEHDRHDAAVLLVDPQSAERRRVLGRIPLDDRDHAVRGGAAGPMG